MERNQMNYNRNFTLILYPEDKTHMEALEKIQKNYDCAFILHNKDVTEDGEIKKEHYHCVLRVGANPRWRSAVAEELKLSLSHIEGCNLEKQLRYLIHFDNPDKYQYDIEEVKGNLKKRVKESINKDKMTEVEKVGKIIEYIENSKKKIRISEISLWCNENGLWGAFRRSQIIFLKMIEETNRRRL